MLTRNFILILVGVHLVLSAPIPDSGESEHEQYVLKRARPFLETSASNHTQVIPDQTTNETSIWSAFQIEQEEETKTEPLIKIGRVKRAQATRGQRPAAQRPKPRPKFGPSENKKFAQNVVPYRMTKDTGREHQNIKFSTQHLFNPLQEAKKNGRNWDYNPDKWTKKQWNEFYSDRAKHEPGLIGKKVNTLVAANERDLYKSALKGEKFSKDSKSTLYKSGHKHRAYTLESHPNRPKEVTLTKSEFGKVVLGLDSAKRPIHFEQMAPGSQSINANIKRWKNLKPKNNPKDAIKRIGGIVKGNRQNKIIQQITRNLS